MGALLVDLISCFLPAYRGLFAWVVANRIITIANSFPQGGAIPTAIWIETLLVLVVYFCPTDLVTMLVVFAVLLSQWSALRRVKEPLGGVNRLIYMHLGSMAVVLLQATAGLWRPYY